MYDESKSAAQQDGANFDMDRARAEFLANQDKEQQSALANVQGPTGTYAQYSSGYNPMTATAPKASEARWNMIQQAGKLQDQQGALGALSSSYSAQNTPIAQQIRQQLAGMMPGIQAQGAADDQAWKTSMRAGYSPAVSGYSSVSDANRPSWALAPGQAVGYANGGVVNNAWVSQLRDAYNTKGIAAARALATQFGIPATESIEPYTTGTNTGNPAYGAVGEMSADKGWTGNVDGSSVATRIYDPANAEHAALMKQLAEGLQGIIAGGNNDEARRIYNEKQKQYGFTDAEFQPFTAGMGELPEGGATPPMIYEWKGGTDAVTDPVTTPAVKTATQTATIDNKSTNGDQTVHDQTTGGVNSPGVIGNQNVTGNNVSGAGNILGNNNISNSNNNSYQGWGTAGATAPTFQTPVLDALYKNQQQNMTSAAPVFDFQKKFKRGGVVSPLMKQK